MVEGLKKCVEPDESPKNEWQNVTHHQTLTWAQINPKPMDAKWSDWEEKQEFSQACRCVPTGRDRDREKDRETETEREKGGDEKWKGQGGHHNCRVCFSMQTDQGRGAWGRYQITHTHRQERTHMHTNTHTFHSHFEVYCCLGREELTSFVEVWV